MSVKHGRRGVGVAILMTGVATMGIGATLAAMDLGKLYQEAAGDPDGVGAPEDDAEGIARSILGRVGLAAAGLPFTMVGVFMLRRAQFRSQRGR